MPTPARVRFPRSNITGRFPELLEPGSAAINWPDRKVYFGDPAGVPKLFSQLIDDWDQNLAYYLGDFAVRDGEIIRATENVEPGQLFDADQWQTYTVNAIARYAEPNATGLLSGGEITLIGTELAVAAGSGVVVDAVQPLAATFTPVAWPAFEIDIPLGSTDTFTVAMDDDGVLSFTASASVTAAFRRSHIILGYVRTEAPSTIVDVVSTPLPVSATSESVRDYYTALGGPRIAAGLVLSAVGANLKVKASAGVVFAFGREWHDDVADPNFTTIPAANPLFFTQHLRSGLRVSVDDGSDLDPTVYDNAGAATEVPAGKVTIQYLWMDPTGSVVEVQLGQTLYDSVAAAHAALGFDFSMLVKMPATRDRVLLGGVILDEAATDLSDGTEAYVALPLADGTFIRTYPVPGADLTLYLLRDGSLPMTDDLDMDNNAIIDAVIDGGTY